MKKPIKKSKTGKAIKGTQENMLPEKAPKGRTASQIMHKHIRDEKHVITDEDFKNMDIDPNADNDTSNTSKIPDDSDLPKDEDKDNKIISPWDVIN